MQRYFPSVGTPEPRQINFAHMGVHLTLLGTGTSQGVPVIGCDCGVCSSTHAKDKRLRSSAMFEVDGTEAPDGPRRLVVDTGPDFRQQMLRADVKALDAVLFTHEHKDHVAGLDDIRAFNFRSKRDMDVYATPQVQEALKREFHYVFRPNPYPGVPRVRLHTLDASPLQIGGVEVIPLPVMHYKLPVLGFRIGPIAYITDANAFSQETWSRLEGVEVLVLNALRKESHISHFNLEEALEVISKVAPRQAYLTHISHLLGTQEAIEAELPHGVSLGWDGLRISIP